MSVRAFLDTNILIYFYSENAAIKKDITCHVLNIHDCLMLASALEDNCSIIFTEDMNDGQIINDILKITDPFKETKPFTGGIMNTITYRHLALNECERIKEIDASQFIKRAWREVNGVRQLVDINYHDPGFPDGYENHLAALRETVEMAGIALGAFDNDRLIGFISINNKIFGKSHKYVLLDQLFISNEYRRTGIGKRLFLMAAEEAKQWNADKFYICAGSAEETISFYFAIGCEEAKEINKELYEDDTRDYQLEYELQNEAWNFK